LLPFWDLFVLAQFRSIKNLQVVVLQVQGVAWMVMSLICIVIYFDGPPSTTVSESYMGQFNRWVYIIFLYGQYQSSTNLY
jgi:hypothetical protein